MPSIVTDPLGATKRATSGGASKSKGKKKARSRAAAISAVTPALIRVIYPPQHLGKGLGIYALGAPLDEALLAAQRIAVLPAKVSFLAAPDRIAARTPAQP